MGHRNGSLDVLRALAIVMVVGCHVYTHFEPGGPAARVAGYGGRGVDLFFVLSGFLLGQQLFAERERTGTVNVPRFWLRRAMRTLPAYYAVLALTLAQAVWSHGWGAIDPRYFIFLQNYMPTTPYFGISWSLCVEEHFYLFVGPLVLLAGRYRPAAWLSVALLAVPTVCRQMGWYWTEGAFETHVRYDQCAAGVMLAWVSVDRPGWWRVLRRWAWLPAAAGAAGVVYLVLAPQAPWPWDAYVATETAFWTLTFTAWVLLGDSSEWWVRRPNFRPTRYLADRAYALYLLHVDAISAVRLLDRRLGEELPLWAKFVLVWAVGLAAAEVLHRLVELPGIRMREWFALTRSSRRDRVQGQVHPLPEMGEEKDGASHPVRAATVRER